MTQTIHATHFRPVSIDAFLPPSQFTHTQYSKWQSNNETSAVAYIIDKTWIKQLNHIALLNKSSQSYEASLAVVVLHWSRGAIAPPVFGFAPQFSMMVGCIDSLSVSRQSPIQVVTGPTAQCRATTMIETNVLPLHHVPLHKFTTSVGMTFVSNEHSTTTDQRCISLSMAEMSSSETTSVLPDSATNNSKTTFTLTPIQVLVPVWVIHTPKLVREERAWSLVQAKTTVLQFRPAQLQLCENCEIPWISYKSLLQYRRKCCT